jgi:hypothetical protein
MFKGIAEAFIVPNLVFGRFTGTIYIFAGTARETDGIAAASPCTLAVFLLGGSLASFLL